MDFDAIPQARVVRKGGQLFAPPPAPREPPEPNPIRDQLRAIVGVAIGLWPLTSVVLLAAGLMWMAGMNGAP